jgi:hypothetical protein
MHLTIPKSLLVPRKAISQSRVSTKNTDGQKTPDRAMEESEDIQADLGNGRVSEEQMDGMMRECVNRSDKGVATMSEELARL